MFLFRTAPAGHGSLQSYFCEHGRNTERGVIECASSFSFLLLVYVCVSAMSVIMATTTTMMGVHYIWRAKCKRSKISLVGLATAVACL